MRNCQRLARINQCRNKKSCVFHCIYEPALKLSKQNIFSASQRGDLGLVKQLVESGQATVNDRDPQNISPLHWAAINAHLALCRYLLEQGAEVDVVGGELMATPLQWAARYAIIALTRTGG